MCMPIIRKPKEWEVYNGSELCLCGRKAKRVARFIGARMKVYKCTKDNCCG